MSSTPSRRLVNPLLGVYFGIFSSLLVAIALLALIFEQLGLDDGLLRGLVACGLVLLLVTIALATITGELGTPVDADAWAVRREDGSWLCDGLIPVPELKDRLELKALPEEDRGRYNTLAGMIMLLLGRLPRVADHVEWDGWRFEVVDLDGKRIDKVLVAPIPEPGEPA